MPKRWAYKHGAYFYRPREAEREAFDGKTWFRLGKSYGEALATAIDEARRCKPRASLYLFPNRKGQCHVNEKGECGSWGNAWRLSMSKAMEKTGLKNTFTIHDLRAKVGSDAENDARAQELLDHTSASVTRQHYRRKRRAIRPVK